MIDFRPIVQIVGMILCLLAAAMTVPAMADLISGHWEWQVFVAIRASDGAQTARAASSPHSGQGQGSCERLIGCQPPNSPQARQR
jgi:hypothetical protein